MTGRDRLQGFVERVRRRILGLEPGILNALVRGYTILTASLSLVELARIFSSGRLELLFAGPLSRPSLDKAFTPLRVRLRTVVERGIELATNDLPSRRGMLRSQGGVDLLEPRTLQAIQTLTGDAIQQIENNVRDSVRQAATAARQENLPATAIAEVVRDAVSLTAPGELAVRNLRAALQNGQVAKALSYTLRDTRHDKLIQRLKDPNAPRLTATQIETIVDGYKRGRTAHERAVASSDATFAAYKQSQILAWQTAIENGVIDAGSLYRQWITMEDSKVRPAHRAMHGQTVPVGKPYSTGQQFAGEGDYGCRCIDRFVPA
jgi:hypothetical protein